MSECGRYFVVCKRCKYLVIFTIKAHWWPWICDNNKHIWFIILVEVDSLDHKLSSKKYHRFFFNLYTWFYYLFNFLQKMYFQLRIIWFSFIHRDSDIHLSVIPQEVCFESLMKLLLITVLVSFLLVYILSSPVLVFC